MSSRGLGLGILGLFGLVCLEPFLEAVGTAECALGGGGGGRTFGEGEVVSYDEVVAVGAVHRLFHCSVYSAALRRVSGLS